MKRNFPICVLQLEIELWSGSLNIQFKFPGHQFAKIEGSYFHVVKLHKVYAVGIHYSVVPWLYLMCFLLPYIVSFSNESFKS